MRHAGMHWPANAGGEHPDRGTIYALPGVEDGCLLMLADSARYWYEEARIHSKTVVWRGLPRPNKLPAKLKWDPGRVADEVLNLWDEQSHGGTEYFQPLNELQFKKESGEDWQGYADMAAKLRGLRMALRNRLPPSVWLVFPPWVPGDDLANIGEWAHEAGQWDVIGLHAYDSADSIRSRYYEYRQQFPTHHIFIGEWNANHGGHNEEQALEALAEIAEKDELFLGATYYIWETNNEGENDLSVWGNGDRLALFQNPPGAPSVEPPVEPPVDDFPIPVDQDGNEWQASRETVKNDCPAVAAEFGIPTYLLWAGFMAEAGEDLQQQERWHIWTPEAKVYIQQRNKAGLRDILMRCAAKGTNDISMGVGHRAYFWWSEYPGDRQPPEPEQYDLDLILNFRKKMIQDHGYAMRDMAKTLAANWKKTGGDPRQTLYLYNKPDGTASDGVKANYNDKLAKSMVEWEVTAPPVQPPVEDGGAVLFEVYTDPQPAGSFLRQPKGCIWHGSRSGKASNPIEAEYKGTANYEVGNPDGLGWSATIGHYKVALHIDPSMWGWNARAASDDYLAVEFAQPVEAANITGGQVEAFCQWWVKYAKKKWPNIPDYFPTHAEVEHSGETGQIDGKTDVFSYGSARTEALRAAVNKRLAELYGGGTTPVPPDPVDEPIQVSKASWERMVNGLGYIRDDIPKRIEANRTKKGDAHDNEDHAIAVEVNRAAAEAMA